MTRASLRAAVWQRALPQPQIARPRCEMYVCAWCQTQMDLPAGNIDGRPTLKHGMCGPCLSAQLQRLPDPRPAEARAAI